MVTCSDCKFYKHNTNYCRLINMQQRPSAQKCDWYKSRKYKGVTKTSRRKYK